MISIDSITIIFSMTVSCLILIYYSNSLLVYRNSRIQSNFIIICGNIILCIISFMHRPLFNTLGFFVVNFIILYVGFKDSAVSIFMRVFVLLCLMMFGELIMSLIFKVTIAFKSFEHLSVMEDIIFSLLSKLIYLIGVVLLRRVSLCRNNLCKSREIRWALILPISTIGYLILLNIISSELNMLYKILFVFVGIMLIASNFVIYIACDRIIDKNIQIQELKDIENKKEIDYKSYELIKEKYEELKIMTHDFEKLCNNIEGMLTDDQIEILSIIYDIRSKCKEFMLVEYTNNKALNILLSQKMQECNRNKIDFQIYIKNIDLSFIKESDVVSIFANLIDNAIESCVTSKDKRMFLSINIMNESLAVIQMDNSSDCEPTVVGGSLQTHKLHKKIHGIGMSSIEKALKNYNGKLRWEYDNKAYVFRTILIVNRKNVKN